MTSVYHTIIVDDDEIDRLTTVSFARRYPFLYLAGVFASATDALTFMDSDAGAQVQVLLLDIDMPGLNGLEFRRHLLNVPACLFITSYPDYAVEGFEVAALDFLIKPLKADRFAHAMARLQDFMDTRTKANLFECSLGGDAIFIKEGHDQIKVKLHDIVYLEAMKDYTRVVTAGRVYSVLSTLGKLLEEAAFASFVRIHRSYAVQKHFVNRITAQEVFVGQVALPVGRSYKDSVNRGLMID